MSSFLLGLITAVLETYLALTGSVADYYFSVFPSDTVHVTHTTSTPEAKPTDTTLALTRLESTYEPLPPILIDNSLNLSASVGNAARIGSTTTDVEAASVNIFCTYRDGDYLHAQSGSGFFIHEKGVILTNAHVAYTLLLEDVRGDSDCVVRTGNPATPTYETNLLYISTAWILKHANDLASSTPRGTGERDFALLYVTDSLTSEPMPARFPALAIDTNELQPRQLNRTVTVAGYPATTLFQNEGAEGDLLFQTAISSITELLTFGSNRADIFSISGTALGEQGVSGGPILTTDAQVIGIVSTLGDPTQFGAGSLRALTVPYINRTIIEETTRSLIDHASGNLPFQAKIFSETMAPFLQDVLVNAGAN